MSAKELYVKIIKELDGRDMSKMSVQELGALLSVVCMMRSYEQTDAYYYNGAVCRCTERGE